MTTGISNNVGPVKSFLRALLHSLLRVVLFVFFDLCIDDHGSFVICRATSVRPKHLSDQNLDHDYYFKLPFQGAGCPITRRRSTSRHARLRAFPRANRTRPTANSPNRFATSSTTEHRVFWPWPLWQFFFPGASSGAYTDVSSAAQQPLVAV